MVQETRIALLNRKQVRKGSYVLYWMQASQRAECNHALEYAVRQANDRHEPVIVYFGLTDNYPEANERHYYFMLEGLKEVQGSLGERGIKMVIGHESPQIGAVHLSKQASLIVCDRGYLKLQRQWRQYVAQNIDCPIIQVESDVVVPVEEASPKEEYAAATLRPKIKRELPKYLVPFTEQNPRVGSLHIELDSINISDIDTIIGDLNIDRSVKRVKLFHGGTSEAKRHLEEFINTKLDQFPEMRNDPNANCLSNMSPYLHFGQISPLYITIRILETGSPAAEAYLEELIIRRELSINFTFYNRQYDSFDGLPGWAKKTLLEHRNDSREYTYTVEELETARTHDPYWNAAQREMLVTGKMHGYMRMYWGKKIIEWSQTPEEAFKIALYLNNKYELDGRDPNGFTGVAWCFGKHDRPWAGRAIFGKVRFMSADGLKRKFDADKYARKYSLNKSQSPPKPNTKDDI